jgi:predicted nucleotidyltransferase
MEYEQIVWKRRIRNKRGSLKSFEDLPIKAQEDFKSIKKFLEISFNKPVQAYVFGSYLHGFWDEFSDYDVIINEMCGRRKLDELILERLNLKVNILCVEEVGKISIP